MILWPFPEMENCRNKNVYVSAILFCLNSCYNLWKAVLQGNEYLDELLYEIFQFCVHNKLIITEQFGRMASIHTEVSLITSKN